MFSFAANRGGQAFRSHVCTRFKKLARRRLDWVDRRHPIWGCVHWKPLDQHKDKKPGKLAAESKNKKHPDSRRHQCRGNKGVRIFINHPPNRSSKGLKLLHRNGIL